MNPVYGAAAVIREDLVPSKGLRLIESLASLTMTYRAACKLLPLAGVLTLALAADVGRKRPSSPKCSRVNRLKRGGEPGKRVTFQALCRPTTVQEYRTDLYRRIKSPCRALSQRQPRPRQAQVREQGEGSSRSRSNRGHSECPPVEDPQAASVGPAVSDPERSRAAASSAAMDAGVWLGCDHQCRQRQEPGRSK